MKRAFDLILTVLSMPAWLLMIAVVAVQVRFKLGAPVFFRQERAGLRGRPFRMVKFRSMLDLRDSSGAPLPDADRLPEFGRWLRSTSLDELPELWNVLTGDMSLVGPRPLYMDYLRLYSPEQARRHDVRPGLTGWAQVNGRNAISWEERLRLDVWYVDHRSLALDLRILMITIARVIGRRGVSAAGEATMSRFTGTRQ